MAEPILFIGGSADGRRISVGGPEGKPVMIQPEAPFSFKPPETEEGPTQKRPPVEWYDEAALHGRARRFTVYALRGLDGDDIMAALLGNYANG